MSQIASLRLVVVKNATCLGLVRFRGTYGRICCRWPAVRAGIQRDRDPSSGCSAGRKGARSCEML